MDQQTSLASEEAQVMVAVLAGHAMLPRTARWSRSGQRCVEIMHGEWLRRQTWEQPVRSGLPAPKDPYLYSPVVSYGGGHQRGQDLLRGYTTLRRVHRYRCGYRFLCYIVPVLHSP